MKLRNLPTRLATGAFIAHSGWEKWKGGPQQAEYIHGSAAGAYPALQEVKPTDFLKMVSAGELAVGAALLTPFVSNKLAGAALAGFSGALLGMYLRTPALHKPGSVWPTPDGIGISKDVWMLGIAAGLLLEPSKDHR